MGTVSQPIDQSSSHPCQLRQVSLVFAKIFGDDGLVESVVNFLCCALKKRALDPSRAPMPPPDPSMTGDMPRHSSRLSAREPTRKRRRAPPPLSVTNVFADSRLPESAQSLWRWPVTSWYFGDVGNADLHIISDRPFIKNVANLPPLEKHYRLRWLEEDATRFVEGHHPQPPEPLPVIPYARQKDTTACARPSKGLGTGIERNAPGRPRKRQCIPKEAPVVPPATIDFLDSADHVKTPPVALPPDAGASQSGPVVSVPQQTAVKVDSPPVVAKPELHLVDVKPQNTLKSPSNISPASNFCTPPLSIPSPIVPSPAETVPCETPLENISTPSPSPQSIPPRKDDAEELITSHHKHILKDKKSEDDKVDDDSHEEVLLQFVSPVEPRLMGTLTYSIPINPAPAPEKEEKDAIVNDARPEVNDNIFAEEEIRVGGMDLEFRKATRPFDECFDDRDTADELRPEILRLNTLLNGLGPKTKPLRNMIHTVVQSEIQRQNKRGEAEAEEQRIIARLKQIEKEKAAAKAAEKAAQAKAKAKTTGRRASVRFGGIQGRRRRPSRKIQNEAYSDEDDVLPADHDNGANEDIRLASMPVVIVDKPSQITENKIVDNRKLLVKPEYQATFDVDRAVLKSPSPSPAGDKAPMVESLIERTPSESFPSRRVEGDTCEVNHKSVKLEPGDKPDVPPEVDSSVKPSIENDDSNNVEAEPAENKGSQHIQTVLDETPASLIVSPGCIKQFELDQDGNQASSDDLNLLKPASPSAEDLSANTSNEKKLKALVEVTNLQHKCLSEQLMKPRFAEPQSSPGESTTDMCDGAPKQLTPLEVETEATTTPITEIDMDVTPDSDDESKPKDISEEFEVELKVETASGSGKEYVDPDGPLVAQTKDGSPVIFVRDGRVDEQPDRMPSPVSPLQAAAPACGFVVVPTTGPTKVLTTGSALVNHMKAIHAEAAKKGSLQNGS